MTRIKQTQAKNNQRLPALLAAGLLLLTLACGAGGSEVLMARRLPTLTPTRLPSLTPTASAAQLAAAVQQAAGPQGEANAQAAPEQPVAVTSRDPAQAAPQEQAAAEAAPAAPAGSSTTPQAVAAAPSPTPLPPTETPTPTATATATAIPPTPTETPLPTDTPTITPTPLPEGWVFTGLRSTSAESMSMDMDGLLFFGDLINNTGAAQNLTHINTIYYDPGGQKIPYGATIIYVPVRIIPPGGRVPFELIAEDLDNVADLDLEAVAQPGEEPPRQDFEFVDITSTGDGPKYCITGRLRNPGQPLTAYLRMVAVLYDSQDQVINFGYSQPVAPADLAGETTADVNFCVNHQNQEVARYELRAWGL